MCSHYLGNRKIIKTSKRVRWPESVRPSSQLVLHLGAPGRGGAPEVLVSPQWLQGRGTRAVEACMPRAVLWRDLGERLLSGPVEPMEPLRFPCCLGFCYWQRVGGGMELALDSAFHQLESQSHLSAQSNACSLVWR